MLSQLLLTAADDAELQKAKKNGRVYTPPTPSGLPPACAGNALPQVRTGGPRSTQPAAVSQLLLPSRRSVAFVVDLLAFRSGRWSGSSESPRLAFLTHPIHALLVGVADL